MTIIPTKVFFEGKKSKKEFINRLQTDNTIPNGLKNSLLCSLKYIFSYIIIEGEKAIGFISGEIIEEEYLTDADILLTYFYILPEYRGNEYIVNALKEFSLLIKETEGINLLKFYVSKENKSSIKVMEKIKAKENNIESEFYLHIWR